MDQQAVEDRGQDATCMLVPKLLDICWQVSDWQVLIAAAADHHVCGGMCRLPTAVQPLSTQHDARVKCSILLHVTAADCMHQSEDMQHLHRKYLTCTKCPVTVKHWTSSSLPVLARRLLLLVTIGATSAAT